MARNRASRTAKAKVRFWRLGMNATNEIYIVNQWIMHSAILSIIESVVLIVYNAVTVPVFQLNRLAPTGWRK